MSSNLFDDLNAFQEFVGAHFPAGHADISLEEALKEFREQQQWQPRTKLGEQLKELRAQFIESGGRLLSSTEIAAELQARRGESFSEA